MSSEADPSVHRSETYQDIVRRLAASAGKSNRGAPAYTRWVNRPLGRRLAALAYLRGMTPNQLTGMNALIIFPVMLGLASIRPLWFWTVPAALLLMLGYILDSSDGQLARLRGGGSKAGEWLDHVVDALKTIMFHGVVVVAWYRFYDFESGAWLLVPLAFGIIHSTFFFSLMLADDLRKIAKIERGVAPPTGPASAEPAPVLRSFLVLPNDWGVMCIVIATLAVQPLFVFLYGMLMLANALFLLAGWVRWYRELVTL